MRENLTSGSRWQGMETRHGDGTEALSQETESNGSATPKSRRHPLTLPIHIHNQRDRLSPEGFQAKLKCIEHHCDWLLQQSLTDPDASRLQRRYQKHRQSLFVFLYRSDVSPTNNVSERALRPSVIHRKVIGCFRSKWGAHAYAALATVIDTAELNGIHAFAAIQSLFGRPSLPLPLGA